MKINLDKIKSKKQIQNIKIVYLINLVIYKIQKYIKINLVYIKFKNYIKIVYLINLVIYNIYYYNNLNYKSN